uniref:EKAL domain-containing protein n=1 Tax=Meloidogyne hapla TaxID=6305 RepID=A0A1I8BQC2_MELHA
MKILKLAVILLFYDTCFCGKDNSFKKALIHSGLCLNCKGFNNEADIVSEGSSTTNEENSAENYNSGKVRMDFASTSSNQPEEIEMDKSNPIGISKKQHKKSQSESNINLNRHNTEKSEDKLDEGQLLRCPPTGMIEEIGENIEDDLSDRTPHLDLEKRIYGIRLSQHEDSEEIEEEGSFRNKGKREILEKLGSIMNTYKKEADENIRNNDSEASASHKQNLENQTIPEEVQIKKNIDNRTELKGHSSKDVVKQSEKVHEIKIATSEDNENIVENLQKRNNEEKFKENEVPGPIPFGSPINNYVTEDDLAKRINENLPNVNSKKWKDGIFKYDGRFLQDFGGPYAGYLIRERASTELTRADSQRTRKRSVKDKEKKLKVIKGGNNEKDIKKVSRKLGDFLSLKSKESESIKVKELEDLNFNEEFDKITSTKIRKSKRLPKAAHYLDYIKKRGLKTNYRPSFKKSGRKHKKLLTKLPKYFNLKDGNEMQNKLNLQKFLELKNKDNLEKEKFPSDLIKIKEGDLPVGKIKGVDEEKGKEDQGGKVIEDEIIFDESLEKFKELDKNSKIPLPEAGRGIELNRNMPETVQKCQVTRGYDKTTELNTNKDDAEEISMKMEGNELESDNEEM